MASGNTFFASLKQACAEEWRAYLNSLRPESQGGQDRIGDWDKSYIVLPEKDRWAAFIDPRQVFVGLNLTMDVDLR